MHGNISGDQLDRIKAVKGSSRQMTDSHLNVDPAAHTTLHEHTSVKNVLLSRFGLAMRCGENGEWSITYQVKGGEPVQTKGNHSSIAVRGIVEQPNRPRPSKKYWVRPAISYGEAGRESLADMIGGNGEPAHHGRAERSLISRKQFVPKLTPYSP